MVLKFYNTLTKKKEVFKPLKKGFVSIYNCGPTVYDFAHIGNFRAYIFADILRRYLEWKGFRVKQVMNITDVGHMTFDEAAEGSGEDKIEKSAREKKTTPEQIAKFYTKAFFEDVEKLNIKKATVYPRATEHIKEIQKIVKDLLSKGLAYEVNGSVYYNVNKFRGYGKLSGNTVARLKKGARVEVNPEKKNWYDFALWIKNPKHIMQWKSPWGNGYPGWHIECSAMSMKYLGQTIDIHTGGEDNIFPHHECEIAQSEGFTGKPFVKYWLHVRHLMVNGEKMSKSKGNFYTLRDLLEKGYKPMAIRYVLLSGQYRTRLNFTERGIKEAESIVKKLEEFVSSAKKGKDGRGMENLILKARKDFEKAMDNNLNTPKALAAIFHFTRKANSIGAGKKAYKTILDFDRVLGLGLEKAELAWHTLKEARGKVKQMIAKREKFRKEKNWKDSDRIRADLRKQGIILEDTKKGVRWRRA